jgi:hypothetical protein
MSEPTTQREATRLAPAVFVIAAAKLVLHLLFITRYGVFRDELYYIDCARHLHWGYVDQPPLIALIARVALWFGDALWILRLPAVVAGAALVVLVGALVRELGGGRVAQILAALCVLTAPAYLLFFHLLTMNALEPLFWVGAAFLVTRFLRTRDGRLWLWFGLLSGVGLLDKYSMLFMGFALVAGLLLAGEWRVFKTRWIWIGGAVALLVFLPNLLWQASHGFPQLEMLRLTRAHRDIHQTPLGYLKDQLLAMNPLGALVWVGGLVGAFASARLRRSRPLAWAYLVLLALFIAIGAKVYYLYPVYGVVFALGGVAWEGWTTSPAPSWRRSLRFVLPSLLFAVGAVLAPVVFPVLPEERYGAYVQALGVEQPHMEKGRDAGRLPQIFADMHGWDTMAAQVSEVFHALPPAEQSKACVFGQNYGEAGAINYFGPHLGLPRAISTHNSYWLWGPQGCDGAVTLVIGGDEDANRDHCLSLERGGTVHNEWARPDEDDLPIWICRGQKYPVDELWAQSRNYG